ncbi:hypothetical protein GCM10011510_15600 [Streptococcus himalayensis]|uniref:Uncharacterized protein n=1 Tax=Streptococcus himalayensis TaxID=1888195 RepID=A0A917EHD1_9STRE|nr:hypothetical protein GCM10011510_15600 [Streptococcus himalayensis]
MARNGCCATRQHSISDVINSYSCNFKNSHSIVPTSLLLDFGLTFEGHIMYAYLSLFENKAVSVSQTG